MGYIATDRTRSRVGLQLEQRKPLTPAMRVILAEVMETDYVKLVTSEYDFGLGRPVVFAAFHDDAAIQAELLPSHIIAARVECRDVVVHVHDVGGDTYVATMGASFQHLSALNRFLSYSFTKVEWVDETSGKAPEGALDTLFCDDGLDCVAGVDISGSELLVHSNRGYSSRGAKPRSLNDLIDASAASRVKELQFDVFQVRVAGLAASMAISRPELAQVGG